MPDQRTGLGRDFHLLWLGEGVSILGATTVTVLLPLLAVLELGAGPGWMGLLTAAAWIPWVVIGLPAGAWVDGWSPRRTMILADLASAAALLSVPIAGALGALTLTHLAVAALATGCASVFFRTAYVRLIPLLVPDDLLDGANARLFGTEAAAQVIAPGVAGRLAGAVGAAAGLVAGAVGFCVSVVCLLVIREPGPPRAGAVAGPAGTLRARIADGVRFVCGDAYLRWLVLIGAASNFGLTGVGALLVLHLVDLGLDESGVARFFMVAAIGGVIGSTVGKRLAERLGSGRASTVLLLSAPCALLIALPVTADQVWIAALGQALVGMAVVGGNVVRGAWRQRYVPSELLGRVLTASSSVNYGTMPLAGLAAGWAGGAIGVRPTILVMIGIHVLASALVLISPLARLRELPARPATPPGG